MRWELNGHGYFKNPGENAKEQEIRIEFLRRGDSEWTIIAAQNKPFGWDKMQDMKDMKDTRGEVLVHVDDGQVQELIETVLKVIAIDQGK